MIEDGWRWGEEFGGIIFVMGHCLGKQRRRLLMVIVIYRFVQRYLRVWYVKSIERRFLDSFGETLGLIS